MADDPYPSLANAYKKPEKGGKKRKDGDIDGDGDDIVAEAKEAFQAIQEVESENRKDALDDLRFARLAEQWPDNIVKQRAIEGRPCHTINRLPAFIRQVVNDARQNKPSIKVHPVDSEADPETADIYNGLIRNIEATSDADVAYDTATENAVTMGWGYLKVDLDYAHDDTFDLDLKIKRVSNPFSIYGDPNSSAADSSDWMSAFELVTLTREAFESQFNDADAVDFTDEGIDKKICEYGDSLTIAHWWTREEVQRPIYLLTDGRIVDDAMLDMPISDEEFQVVAQMMAMQGMQPPQQPPTQRDMLSLTGGGIKNERTAKTWKVTKRILSGADELANDEWAGIYIPIIPVYGDEVDVEGKRYFRSLIRDAKDSQRDHNYWRTTATEVVALAPRVPFIGRKGAFKTDAKKWAEANRVSHAYLEYDGDMPPQRQPLDMGGATGALQQALAAADDMKAIMGLYDASLGQRTNETSGRAILARQREGDVSTFHFQDNMTRAVRHTGRILIDLIPKVYNSERVVRVLGEDGEPDHKQLNTPVPVTDPQTGQPVMQQDPQTGQVSPVTRIYDLSAGKYDLTVKSGPSFTSRREESANQMMEMVRAFPQAAPLIGDLIAKNLDWPGADDIADRLKAMLPPQASGGLPPELQQQIQEGTAQIQKLTQENEALKADREIDQQKLLLEKQKLDNEARKIEVEGAVGSIVPPADPMAMEKVRLDEQKNAIESYKAETERMGVAAQAIAAMNPPQPMHDPAMGVAGDTPIVAEEAPLPSEMARATEILTQTAQLMAQAVAHIAAPKEIVRDADGRPAGIRAMIQ